MKMPISMPNSMPLPRKKMPSPMPTPMPTPTRKMPRILILMPFVALTLGFSDNASACAREEDRPKSAKGHVRSCLTEEDRLTTLIQNWDTRLAEATASDTDDLREAHLVINKEMEAELASLHRFLNPSTLPVTQSAPSDFESDEEEEDAAYTPLDVSAAWAKGRMENWQIWAHTGANPEAKKMHKRGSSVSIASIDSQDADEAFRRNHDTVKENLTATLLNLARKVDVKKVEIARKGTLV